MNKLDQNLRDLNNNCGDFSWLKIPGNSILFAKVWGSYSHNTNLPDSDVDYIGVWVAPTRDMLSISKPTETITHEKPDTEIHEVEKFCRLLIKGNPSMIETLFTEKLIVYKSEWWALFQNRKRFISKQVIKQYLGYAGGQLQRLRNDKPLHTSGGKYNTKWAYHMVRILNDADRMVHGLEPTIWKEGPERDQLMAIRNGDLSQDQVESIAQSLVEDIDKTKPWPLPDIGDEEFLNSWLIDLRFTNLNKV